MHMHIIIAEMVQPVVPEGAYIAEIGKHITQISAWFDHHILLLAARIQCHIATHRGN